MASMRIDYTTMEWSSAVPFYGPAAVYDAEQAAHGGVVRRLLPASTLVLVTPCSSALSMA